MGIDVRPDDYILMNPAKNRQDTLDKISIPDYREF